MEKNFNGNAKAMNDLRNNILNEKYYCFGWPYTYNADPGCLEDEDSIENFKREIEDNAIVEITDPEDREIALAQLDIDSSYEGPVYQAGSVLFATD